MVYLNTLSVISYYTFFIVLCNILIYTSRYSYAFELQQYYERNKWQSRDIFIQDFPYDAYLKKIQITDFQTLQSHRYFLWQKLGDGDEFLCHIGDKFMKNYLVKGTIEDLQSGITIGEAYLNPNKGFNQGTNKLYQTIGFYILGRIAQTIEKEIAEGKFNLSDHNNSILIKRLEENKIFVAVEQSGLSKIWENIKKGNFGYVLDRVKAFGEEFLKPNSSFNNQSRFRLKYYKNIQPGTNIFIMYDSNNTEIGQAIWLQRPQLKVTYFAYQNVFDKYSAFKKSNSVVLATTGGFTNILKQPEGLTIEDGNVVNAIVMHDRHGLVMVNNGGINVLNLKTDSFLLPQQGPKIDSPLNSLVSYYRLLQWSKSNQATLFQTQLLVFSDSLIIKENAAKKQMRERRILALSRDKKTQELHHIIFNIIEKYNLAVVSRELFRLLNSRNKKVEAMLNLDVGAYNILNIFDSNNNLLADIKGPVDVYRATNLLVYSR